jgi:hypothetical protein
MCLRAKDMCGKMTPLVCDKFKNCEGLSRIAFLEGIVVMMLGP